MVGRRESWMQASGGSSVHSSVGEASRGDGQCRKRAYAYSCF